MSNSTTTTQVCPQCSNLIPVNPHYIAWCDRCNWNVEPEQAQRPRTVFDSLYESLGKRFGQSLFDEISKSVQLKPQWTVSKALGFLLAGAVHGLALAFSVFGALILLTNSLNCLTLIFVALFWGLAWSAFPRFPKRPIDICSRDKFKTLYDLTDRIAVALNTPEIEGIVIDGKFNAGLGQFGWRQKKILYLGLPLFSILSPQERVAVIAHELAHSVNGDPARKSFVGLAINSLARWHHLSRPDSRMTHRYGIIGTIANFFLFILSRILYLGIYALLHLLWRDTQRAEYLADALSAEVSGTADTTRFLNKLRLHDTYALIAKRMALSSSNLDFFVEFKRQIDQVPDRELERIKRLEQIKSFRFNASHPPTVYRLAILQVNKINQSKVVANSIESEKIERELMPLHEKIQRQITDEYSASLYS